MSSLNREEDRDTVPDTANDGLDDANQWLERYGNAMYRFAMLKLRNPDHAEEVVQETLLAALRSKGSFRGESRVSTWLFSILRFKVADHFRDQHRHRERWSDCEIDSVEVQPKGHATPKNHAWDADPATQYESQEFWKVFQNCVNKLPEKLAEVHMLREINRHSPKDICNMLGISPTNLSMRLHRCRLALRDCLQKNWFQEEDDELP